PSDYIYYFSVSISPDHRHLHSFPTRRSSDLAGHADGAGNVVQPAARQSVLLDLGTRLAARPLHPLQQPVAMAGVDVAVRGAVLRSEEHTSELQSRGHLVCRLLLEKKNNMKHT